MAALRPGPSGLVVGASRSLSFSTLSPRIVQLQPLGRRGSASLLGFDTSTGKMRHHHAVSAQSGATSGPDPDDKKRMIEEQVNIFRQIFKGHLELEKDMPFQEDFEKINEYEEAMTGRNTSIFHIEATTFSHYLCMIARKGVQLASRVMDSASLRPGKQDEISSFTIKQNLLMYVSIFVKLVKDAHDKKFNEKSVFSLLGAFRGVATVGHILLQDALANAGHSSSLVLEAADSWREYEQKMNSLEENFRAVSKSTKAYEILRPTMTDAMRHAILFVYAVVSRHERALGYRPGTKGKRSTGASDVGRSGVSGTSSGST